MFLHELGHVIAAKYLSLHVKKVGFQMKPYPHFYVAASWPRTIRAKNIYLFAGSFVTICLFILFFCFNFFFLKSLLIAFIIQICLETNPLYSDITIAVVSASKKIRYGKSYGIDYAREYSNYKFSIRWYIHFILWTALIILLIKLYYLL
ncbi:hypothetical protein CMT56_15740 [Elizabethkingia anophelis]|nr:hypothetical protein [Elizabethkingia anophelis]MDV3751981.1 hypothetical protein [Elizabethkingia anophelis]MDV3854350.1 hypothetical protein [Elizabethkingia anophelis]MDV3862711.1 hypothetical protein [Elizabethkingia anophelis]MDV3908592.1 hypothetical protein [Elizabethkingia anophelis]